MHSSIHQKPFLKWAGAKTKVMPVLGPLLPEAKGRFIEPFVGSGAVFLNTNYRSYVLADFNADVIALYAALQNEGNAFIEECRKLFVPELNCKNAFIQLRQEFNTSCDSLRRSSLFVYLNRHCFNGLCRYNSSGQFNTPFGRYGNVGFPQESMRAFAAKLQGVELVHADFRKIIGQAGAGDVVYCDPPYVPLTPTANFTSYSSSVFGHREQIVLRDCCEKAAERGATILVSNHDTPVTRALYERASKIVALNVQRRISCDSATRGSAPELIAIFEQPQGAAPLQTQLQLVA